MGIQVCPNTYIMKDMMTVTTKKILRAGIALSALSLIGLSWYGTPLPMINAVVPEVIREAPVQESLPGDKALKRKYGEYDYTFTPRADYQLHGLVVSLHHSDSWIDISHGSDPAQTVDVCVVWGPLISTDAYRKVAYDHGDWTCYIKLKDENDRATYDFINEHHLLESLSNNHLIPHNAEEARVIKSIKVGDQIALTGVLTEYAISKDGTPISTRGTSLTRTDTGSHACETIYLSSITILKRNMPWSEPLQYLLLAIIIMGSIVYFYRSMPKFYTAPIRDLPHKEDPNDAKNFILADADASITKPTQTPPLNIAHTGDPYDVKNYINKDVSRTEVPRPPTT